MSAALANDDRKVMRPARACLGACRTWGVDSENRPQRGQFLPDLQAHSPAMGQEDGEKWTAAVVLLPTIPKSDRLLGPNVGAHNRVRGAFHQNGALRLRVAGHSGATAWIAKSGDVVRFIGHLPTHAQVADIKA